jgi:hypothetical protein
MVTFSHNTHASIIRAVMMVPARTSETSVDNYFTRQYIPEEKSELNIYIFNAVRTLTLMKLVINESS